MGINVDEEETEEEEEVDGSSKAEEKEKEDDAEADGERGMEIMEKGYAQLYIVPVQFWKRYTQYKGREPELEDSAMRQYFAKWGSEDGTRPHMTLTRDRKFIGGDTKAAARQAAQEAMNAFWKRRGSQEKNFRADRKHLSCGFSKAQSANKLK